MEYCEEVNPKSSCSPPVLALLIKLTSIYSLDWEDSGYPDIPNIGSVKVAEKVQHPCTWQNAPIKLADELLLLRRAIDPLRGYLLCLGSINTLVMVIGMTLVGPD